MLVKRMREVEPVSRRRVVISGAGIVSSVGSGRDAFWDGLEQGRSGARRIELDGVGEITACVIGDFDDRRYPETRGEADGQGGSPCGRRGISGARGRWFSVDRPERASAR